MHIYRRALRERMNNEMEFAALEHGLRILKSQRKCNVIVEGDSVLVITTAKRIQGGTKAVRATKHWRLAKVMENIAELMAGMKGLVFQTSGARQTSWRTTWQTLAWTIRTGNGTVVGRRWKAQNLR